MMLVAEHCEAPNSDPFCLIAGSRDGALRAHVAQEFASPLTGLADVRLCAASIVDPVAVPFSDASRLRGFRHATSKSGDLSMRMSCLQKHTQVGLSGN